MTTMYMAPETFLINDRPFFFAESVRNNTIHSKDIDNRGRCIDATDDKGFYVPDATKRNEVIDLLMSISANGWARTKGLYDG